MDKLKVFVGSPNDMETHRHVVRDVVAQLNDERALPYRLDYVDWRIAGAPGAGRPQAVVFRHIGESDIFVAIVGRRLGSPSGVSESGTVEEYERAYDRWRTKAKPEILVYFHQRYRRPNLMEIEALRKVLEFQERVGKQALTWTYGSVDDLRTFARKHLEDTVELIEARSRNYGEEALEEGNLEELRLKLEAKLAYVNKHMLGTPEAPAYSNFGSLAHDRYLPREQAKRLARLVAFQPSSMSGDLPDLDVFARAVRQDVANFRATVFDRHVRKTLRNSGWTVKVIPRKKGKYRPHLRASKDGVRYRIAARLVLSRDSNVLSRELERLEGILTERNVRRRIVVVPDNSPVKATGRSRDPQIVKLKKLVETLEAD